MQSFVSLSERNSSPYRIAVLGLGHVGLPTALGFCSLGWDVIGADADAAKVEMIRAGKPPFFEPGVDHLLQLHLSNGKFRLTHDIAEAIRSATVLFLCVGTPQREDGAADVSQVAEVARTIGKNLNGYKLVVEKSTVPAVTALWIRCTIERNAVKKADAAEWRHADSRKLPAGAPRADFDVASNPEFLREGRAVDDFFTPSRIVLGVDSERARTILEDIYRSIRAPKLVTDTTTAELIKHAANAFLSTKISFINMIADICDAVGADVTRVAEGLGLDPRIGPSFLQAGIGFGGFCFPKDLRALLRLAEDCGVECSLLSSVEEINRKRVEAFLQKVRSFLWVLHGKTIGVLGLAFKPDTDDIREAPSIGIIGQLLQEGAALRLYDPAAMAAVERLYPSTENRVTYCDSAYAAAESADAVLLLTEWDEFRDLDLDRLRDLMQTPLFIDGRNQFDPAEMCEAGFTYVGMGRAGGEAFHREMPVGSHPRTAAHPRAPLAGGLTA